MFKVIKTYTHGCDSDDGCLYFLFVHVQPVYSKQNCLTKLKGNIAFLHCLKDEETKYCLEIIFSIYNIHW